MLSLVFVLVERRSYLSSPIEACPWAALGKGLILPEHDESAAGPQARRLRAQATANLWSLATLEWY
jgi:hypothetical protein